MSYMRMAKVLLTLSLLRKAGVQLEGKSLFDYGFGAGTFFRYCPANTRLIGVELDAQNVAEVTTMLASRGYKDVHLEPIKMSHWEEHPLLDQRYDAVLCSHVLEHLPDPVLFLRRIQNCLGPGGLFIGLVPINERKSNPHHVQIVDQPTIQLWARKSDFEIRCYMEGDQWGYWFQPLYATETESGLPHRVGQIVSMALGIPATILGPQLWRTFGEAFGRLTFSKPTQAAFVLTRRTVTDQQ
jgi:SAM-dependent methyltransferase